MPDGSDYVSCDVCDTLEICLISTCFGDTAFDFDDRLFLCREKEHHVCGSCLDDFDKDSLFDDEEEDLEDGYVPTRFCPICSCQTPTDEMILDFILKKYGKSKNSIIEEMRSKHQS